MEHAVDMEESAMDPPLVPVHRGRPKEKKSSKPRIPNVGESPKRPAKRKCALCNTDGHYKKTCPNPSGLR